MRTFKLTLAYDGTNYAGWQSQLDRQTVQGVLEAALQKITGETIRTIASGRTDAGVHALGQVVSFRSETYLAPEVIARALNATLPNDVRVIASVQASPDFHAIRDAVRKRYRYAISDCPLVNPFERNYVWSFPTRLDVNAMARASRRLIGKHDFASFETSGSERESTVRTVLELSVRRVPTGYAYSHTVLSQTLTDHVWIDIEADGFLYNMVRNIVGTLVEVGRGVQPHAWIEEVLAACDRRKAGPTAPPHGLFLAKVHYKDEPVAPDSKSLTPDP